MVETALAWRYAILAAALGALILSLGLILATGSGSCSSPAPRRARSTPMLVMAPGTSRTQTEATLAALDEALHETAGDLARAPGELLVMSSSSSARR